MSRFYPPPEAGAELESYLERAAAVCGNSRNEILARMSLRVEFPLDLDSALGSPAAQELMSHLGIAPPPGPPLPPKEYRAHYCPICFSEDLAKGIFPYFRTVWSRPWCTHCEPHRTPLFRWEHWNAGARIYPPGIVEQYLGTSRHAPRASKPEPFHAALHMARRVTRWGLSDAKGVYWRQHWLFEQSLIEDSGVSEVLLGASVGDARRVVSDLASFYISNFSSRRAVPIAAHPASFLGPWWLFGGFGVVEPNKRLTLELLDRPERKRSALALAFRTVSALLLDPHLDRDSGMVLDYGENALTRELGKAPLDAARWLKTRMTRWPKPIELAVSSALASA